jgi:predicted MFS family arabinose efflux permease
MVTCDLVRLALMLALALVAVTRLPVVLAPVLAALATAASTPYSPAVSASIPKLVADRDLSGANAVKSGVNSLGIVVGPAIGGLLLLLGAPALAFVINAATFAVSAVCVIAIRTAGSTFRVATHRRQAGLLRSVAEGAVLLNAHPRALWQVGADVVCSLVFGMQTVLLIGVAQRAGLGLHGYGYLFAALGVGCLAGTTLATRALHGSRPRAVLPLSMVAVGFPMLLLAIVTAAPAAVVLIALSGAGSILVEVMTHTLLQRMLPDDALGRAFGFSIPAAAAGMVAGSLAAPVLAGALSDTGALLACGALAVAYAVALLIAPRR